MINGGDGAGVRTGVVGGGCGACFVATNNGKSKEGDTQAYKWYFFHWNKLFQCKYDWYMFAEFYKKGEADEMEGEAANRELKKRILLFARW